MDLIFRGLLFAWLIAGHPALAGAAENPTPDAKDFKTVTLEVQNMDCPLCRITIRKALKKVDGVKEASVDFDTKTARITFDPLATDIEALTPATRNAGYPATLRPE